MDKEMLKLLNESFDRALTERENQQLKAALKSDSALKAEAENISKIRDLLNDQEYSFDPFFTESVIYGIEQEEESSLIVAFNRIALPGLAAAVILLLISFWGSGSLSLDTLMGIDTFKPEYLSDFLLYSN